MDENLRRESPQFSTDHLREPPVAACFVFSLAEQMHQTRTPSLMGLAEPLMFEVTMARLTLCQLFVVVPKFNSPLLDAVIVKGAWHCTPELLDVYLQYTNPFLRWSLPSHLTDLGVERPGKAVFLRACRYYGPERFLTHPGFTVTTAGHQSARSACVETTNEALWADSEPRIDETSGSFSECADSYQQAYALLRLESGRIQDHGASIAETVELPVARMGFFCLPWTGCTIPVAAICCRTKESRFVPFGDQRLSTGAPVFRHT